VIRIVCQYCIVSEKDIREKASPYRGFAMYACRRYGDTSQKQLATAFSLHHSGSCAYSINKVKKEIIEGGWRKLIDWFEKQLNIVKPT